jgi:hypothetical protein
MHADDRALDSGWWRPAELHGNRRPRLFTVSCGRPNLVGGDGVVANASPPNAMTPAATVIANFISFNA